MKKRQTLLATIALYGHHKGITPQDKEMKTNNGCQSKWEREEDEDIVKDVKLWQSLISHSERQVMWYVSPPPSFQLSNSKIWSPLKEGKNGIADEDSFIYSSSVRLPSSVRKWIRDKWSRTEWWMKL